MKLLKQPTLKSDWNRGSGHPSTTLNSEKCIRHRILEGKRTLKEAFTDHDKVRVPTRILEGDQLQQQRYGGVQTSGPGTSEMTGKCKLVSLNCKLQCNYKEPTTFNTIKSNTTSLLQQWSRIWKTCTRKTCLKK